MTNAHTIKRMGVDATFVDPDCTAEELEAVEGLIEDAIYPKSANKLMDMLRRFDEDGFTSFWF